MYAWNQLCLISNINIEPILLSVLRCITFVQYVKSFGINIYFVPLYSCFMEMKYAMLLTNKLVYHWCVCKLIFDIVIALLACIHYNWL